MSTSRTIETGTVGAGGPALPERLRSVDALRGFDMFWIIGAEALARALHKMSDSPVTRFLEVQLEHRDWEGFTFYDLIFPLFVFLVGVSLVFSLSRTVAEEGRTAAMVKVIRRSLILFLFGLIYSGGFSTPWPEIRLLGVLNRIALCYLFAGCFYIFLGTRSRIGVAVVLLVGYWALMTFIPVPGTGAGSFAKGANLANFLDAQYLPGKLYDGTWDPEGLLSTLPAIASCLLGVFAGQFLKTGNVAPFRKVIVLAIAGVVAVALGWLWGTQFPVIKKIWTSSYVLVAAGYSSLLLAWFYLVIDVWKVQAWSWPFIWIGMNAITVYMAAELLNFRNVALRLVGGDVKAFFDTALHQSGDLVVALVELSLAIGLCYFLYRRRIFLRV